MDPAVEPVDQILFATAVAEVASNIIKHGDGGSDRQMTMTLRVGPGELTADFADDGGAVVLAVTRDAPVDELSESGRGLAIARTALDEFSYERTGSLNRWHLMRRRSTNTAND